MAFHLLETVRQILGEVSEAIRQEHSSSDSRSLHITGATGTFSILLGLGKIISGILSLSVFACMNGCYALGIGCGASCRNPWYGFYGRFGICRFSRAANYFLMCNPGNSGICIVDSALLFISRNGSQTDGTGSASCGG